MVRVSAAPRRARHVDTAAHDLGDRVIFGGFRLESCGISGPTGDLLPWPGSDQWPRARMVFVLRCNLGQE
eukprot:scaffold20719_cov62-Phaeocystis_antarctica.AAC.5